MPTGTDRVTKTYAECKMMTTPTTRKAAMSPSVANASRHAAMPARPKTLSLLLVAGGIQHLTLELSGVRFSRVRLDEWLGGHSVSHESKVDKRAYHEDTKCKLQVTQKPVPTCIYSDLDVVQTFVIALI